MKIIFFFLVLTITGTAEIHAQFIYKIKTDSLLVTNDSCTAELNLENSTKNVKGFLFNKGNGRTEFRAGAVKINDSLYLIGADTLNTAGGSRNSWKLTGNSGTSASTNFIGTPDNNPIVFKTNNIERMRLGAGGFGLGIGTNNPQQILHLYGTNPNLYIEGDNLSYYPRIVFKSNLGSSVIEMYGNSSFYPGLHLITPTAHGNIQIGSSIVGAKVVSADSSIIPFQVIGAIRQTNDLFMVSRNLATTPGSFSFANALLVKNTGKISLSEYKNNVAEDSVLSTDTSGNLKFKYITPGSSTPALSSLTAAAATNDINNTNYKQRWRWPSLAGDTAIVINSTNTTAASNAQVGVGVLLKGANATSAQTTTGLSVSNTHTGTTSTNIGLYAEASGANNNYALYTSGNIFMVGNTTFFFGGTGSTDNQISKNGTSLYILGNQHLQLGAGGQFTVHPHFTNKVAIGATASGFNPTASVHLSAGAAAASSAPLKFTSGTLQTAPEAGAVEFDGTNYYATSSTTRYTIAKTLTATSTLDFGSTNAGTSTDLTITVTGAADGDAVSVGVPNAATVANGSFSAWVSASNTVTVRFSNNDLSNALNPASGTFRASVLKY